MRTRSAITALVALAAIVFTGCSSSSSTAAVADRGCNQMVLGVHGTVRPESSNMTCRQIVRMNEAVSPGGAPCFVESPFDKHLWKCRTRGHRPAAPLLRCELGARHFSIVAAN